jgi:hypothetical protein
VKLATGIAWISALGIAHQEPTDEVFVPEKLPTTIDEASRQSYQLSEALDMQLPASVHLRVTGFTTFLQALNLGAQSAHEQSGGIELFLRRDFTQRLGGFVSYTLSRTQDSVDAATYLADGDKTHLLSVVLGYDLGLGWRVGGRFFYESGSPYNVVCPTANCSPGQSTNVYVINGRLPPFYRTDVRLEKRWLFSNERWLAATLECFNALYKSEAAGANYSTSQGLTFNWQGPIILPSIGLEGGF